MYRKLGQRGITLTPKELRMLRRLASEALIIHTACPNPRCDFAEEVAWYHRSAPLMDELAPGSNPKRGDTR